MKHSELVEAKRKVVEIICKKLKQEGITREDSEDGEEHMQLCTMKIFSQLTNPQLESFILAHDTKITSKSQLRTKGTLKEAKNDTARDRIRVAFECRTMTNIIEGMLPFNVSDGPNNDEAENYCVHQITLADNDTIPPSTLLSDAAWVLYVINFLNLKKTANTTTEVSERDKEKADLLLIKLLD